ncbi:OmpA family protein [Flavobacterium sp.]|jgi:outer membrane protein OmpA-like peptidoglycan-associated protein|uniref:OmpA family protein n=1 Tax=Flavobacterium sp. TaxID=239 RepID=UPI0037BF69C7
MKNTVTSLVLLLFFIGFSQEKKIKEADAAYEKLGYMNAVSIYIEVDKNGYGSPDIYKKIADSYYFNGNYVEANKWYMKLFNSSEVLDYEYYYRYAQTLKTVPDIEKSNYYLALFSKLKEADSRAKEYEDNTRYLEQIKSDNGRYEISSLDINSSFSDYGIFEYNRQVIFTSSREHQQVKIDTWTNQPFSGLYVSSLKKNDKFSKPQFFLNSDFFSSNESTAVITKDGLTLYFTRNNFKRKKNKKNSIDEVSLKIYSATFKNGNWTNIQELSFNSDDYNCAHPVLSADEKTLYFSSNMPGTLGQSDLFRVAVLANGSYGIPENLGPEINTEGRETFPYLSVDNELYFASDGHLGLGGLDVFVSKLNADNTFSKPFNIGNPINTAFDDFSYVINNQTNIGYFSSNRPGGKGSDDIYKFFEKKSLFEETDKLFVGKIVDALFGNPIENVVVTLFDDAKTMVDKTTTNATGDFFFKNNYKDKGWYVRYSHEEFETKEDYFINKLQSDFNEITALLPKEVKLQDGLDLAKFFAIQNIYFDLDKWEINDKAEKQIAILLYVMQQNPTIKLEIKAHTDSRASDSYNLELSNKRALATQNWLVKNGIDPTRIISKGYGESMLVNKCANGVKCSEKEHQMNRRSEFIVISN